LAEDAPEKMLDTKLFWNDCAQGKYEIYISDMVTNEIMRCAEPKHSQMLDNLRLINLEVLPETDEIVELATEYIKGGVLREKSFDDCLHIAYAVANNCDVIVSWNFKHLVNFRTIDRVKIINAINRYKEISIVSPTMLLEEDDG
jgi:predicted nucleic acid-binding protein